MFRVVDGGPQGKMLALDVSPVNKHSWQDLPVLNKCGQQCLSRRRGLGSGLEAG